MNIWKEFRFGSHQVKSIKLRLTPIPTGCVEKNAFLLFNLFQPLSFIDSMQNSTLLIYRQNRWVYVTIPGLHQVKSIKQRFTSTLRSSFAKNWFHIRHPRSWNTENRVNIFFNFFTSSTLFANIFLHQCYAKNLHWLRYQNNTYEVLSQNIKLRLWFSMYVSPIKLASSPDEANLVAEGTNKNLSLVFWGKSLWV